MTNWDVFLQKVSQRSPWQILGLDSSASLKDIQEAFDSLSPQAQGEELVKIREAYFTLMDQQASQISALLVPGHDWNLESIYQKTPGTRRYVGPRAWLKALSPTAGQKK